MPKDKIPSSSGLQNESFHEFSLISIGSFGVKDSKNRLNTDTTLSIEILMTYTNISYYFSQTEILFLDNVAYSGIVYAFYFWRKKKGLEGGRILQKVGLTVEE